MLCYVVDKDLLEKYIGDGYIRLQGLFIIGEAEQSLLVARLSTKN